MNLLELFFRWKAIESLFEDFDWLFDPREYPGLSERPIDRELASHSSHPRKAVGRKD